MVPDSQLLLSLPPQLHKWILHHSQDRYLRFLMAPFASGVIHGPLFNSHSQNKPQAVLLSYPLVNIS